MSYDVQLRAPATMPCEHCGRGGEPGETTTDRNYTSNMAGAWDDAGAPLRDMHGWTGERAADAIEAAIAKIEREGRDVWSARYDATNGWGHINTMIDNFLAPFARDCREHPTWLVEIDR